MSNFLCLPCFFLMWISVLFFFPRLCFQRRHVYSKNRWPSEDLLFRAQWESRIYCSSAPFCTLNSDSFFISVLFNAAVHLFLLVRFTQILSLAEDKYTSIHLARAEIYKRLRCCFGFSLMRLASSAGFVLSIKSFSFRLHREWTKAGFVTLNRGLFLLVKMIICGYLGHNCRQIVDNV